MRQLRRHQRLLVTQAHGSLPDGLRVSATTGYPLPCRARNHGGVDSAFDHLRDHGYQRLGTLLTRPQCEHLCALYDHPGHFRSRIEMARYRFGRGEYQYFAYPLPETVSWLRNEFYAHLAPTANSWMAALRAAREFPQT